MTMFPGTDMNMSLCQVEFIGNHYHTRSEIMFDRSGQANGTSIAEDE